MTLAHEVKLHGHRHSDEERRAQSRRLEVRAAARHGVTLPEGMKFCAGCSETKERGEFPQRLSRGPGSVRARCKSCSWRATRSAALAWAKRYKERVRANHVRRTYGLTADQYRALMAAQGGLCAICREPSKKRLCVDHDHETGRVRGLLCHPCNMGLGNFGDDVDRLRRAMSYLK